MATGAMRRDSRVVIRPADHFQITFSCSLRRFLQRCQDCRIAGGRWIGVHQFEVTVTPRRLCNSSL